MSMDLMVIMVSRLYTFPKTHRVIYIKCGQSFLHVHQTSIKRFFTKKKKKKEGLELAHSCSQAGACDESSVSLLSGLKEPLGHIA